MNEIFADALNLIDIDTVMKKSLKENIEKSIQESIDDMFRYNGVARKTIEEKIKNELAINLDSINFQDYVQIIEDEIKNAINNEIKEEVSIKTQKILINQEKIKPLTDINKLVGKFNDELNSNNLDWGDNPTKGEITIDVSEDSGRFSMKNWSDVCIKRDDEEDDNFEIKLRMYKQKIYGIEVDEDYNAGELYDTLKKIYNLGLDIIVEDEEYSYCNVDM